MKMSYVRSNRRDKVPEIFSLDERKAVDANNLVKSKIKLIKEFLWEFRCRDLGGN